METTHPTCLLECSTGHPAYLVYELPVNPSDGVTPVPVELLGAGAVLPPRALQILHAVHVVVVGGQFVQGAPGGAEAA